MNMPAAEEFVCTVLVFSIFLCLSCVFLLGAVGAARVRPRGQRLVIMDGLGSAVGSGEIWNAENAKCFGDSAGGAALAPPRGKLWEGEVGGRPGAWAARRKGRRGGRESERSHETWRMSIESKRAR